MTTVFTADTHFGDHRTINIQRRPFANVAEMDAAWKAVVAPGDVKSSSQVLSHLRTGDHVAHRERGATEEGPQRRVRGGEVASPSRPDRAERLAMLMGGVGMLGGEDLALPYPWITRNGITSPGQ